MPSSIFNSKHCPTSDWARKRTWLLAIAIFLSLCVASELFWRSRGHHPSVSGTKEFWAWHRSQVYDENCLVLIGASRSQSDFHQDVLQERLHDRTIVQLSIAECSPIATLDDLSRDGSFRGDILCGIAEPFIEQRQWDEQLPYVQQYHDSPTSLPALEKIAVASAQSRLAFLHPALKGSKLLQHWYEKQELPKPALRHVRFDRFRPMNIRDADLESKLNYINRQLHKKFDDYSPDQNAWNEGNQMIRQMVERLQSRGCRIVFVRLPTSGQRVPLEDKAYPRELFWNTFEESVSAPCIHFRDDPRLSQFICPDMSHLDHRDAKVFTDRLLDILEEKQFLSTGTH